GILQDLVGLAELLELLLGVLGFVDVGVVFPRQLPIGAIDLVACGSPHDAEQSVIVDELHAGGAPGQSRLAAFSQDTDCRRRRKEGAAPLGGAASAPAACVSARLLAAIRPGSWRRHGNSPSDLRPSPLRSRTSSPRLAPARRFAACPRRFR